MPETECTIHMPHIPWVESPFFEKLLQQKEFDEHTREQVRHFAEEGYVIIDTEMLNEIDQIVSDLDGMYEAGKHSYDSRIQNAWKTHPSVLALSRNQKILDLLKLLYERKPIPFQTLNFHRGTQQCEHSDSVHFHSLPHRFMAGCWVALEDVDDNNGPLFYYPKSHKLPCYTLNDLGVTMGHEGYKYYERFMKSLMEVHGLEKKAVHLKKGEALVWAANLVHGGCDIVDPNRTRLSQVTHYFFEDCIYYDPLHSNLEQGNIHYMNIQNILTGENVPQMRDGKVVDTDLESHIKKSPTLTLKEHVQRILSRSM